MNNLDFRIKAIKEKAKQMNYKQEDLAKLAGISISTIKKIFCGVTQSPRIQNIQKLETILKINYLDESDQIEDAFCEIKPKDAIDFWDSKGNWARFSVTTEDWERFYKFVESVALNKAGKTYWD